MEDIRRIEDKDKDKDRIMTLSTTVQLKPVGPINNNNGYITQNK